MTYPENAMNDGIKLFEQNVLYQMCFAEDGDSFQKLLNQFYSCRLRRQQIIGDFISYEKTVENMEGPAFYCEYMFYNQFSSSTLAVKENYNQKHFFGYLTTPYYGREGLRNRHMGAGMAMCLILNKYFDNWQSEYYAKGVSLYDFFITRFKPQKEELAVTSREYDLSKFHTYQAVLEHELSYKQFNSQPGIKITLTFKKHPQFKGFDPMHAESINDSTILHKTMLSLLGGENDKLHITNKLAITITDEQIWFVKKVILFAPKESITIEKARIVINMEGGNVSWTGNLKMKTEEEIFFKGE